MGGCCGEPKPATEPQNRPTSQYYQPSPYIHQQPQPVPSPSLAPYEKQFAAPAINAPPAAWTAAHTASSVGYGNAPQTHGGQAPLQRMSMSQLPMRYAQPGPNDARPPSVALAQPAPALLSGSPPPALQRPSGSPTGTHSSRSPVPAPDEGRLVISIDFGTTFSGVAYGSSRIAAGKVQQILRWPHAMETFRKIPTCLLYDEHGRVLAWGLEARHATLAQGMFRCEWFKLYLEPEALRDGGAPDPRLPALPPGKKPTDVIVDYLSCLWEYSREQITRDISSVADLDSAEVWLTVPAAWDARGCSIMREAAIQAGLVRSVHAGDRDRWRDRLKIITEPEAAAVHAAELTDLHQLRPGETFLIADCGGGTVDLAVYKLIGERVAHLEIAEVSARSGANCGSIFLDFRFRELVSTLLAQHPAHLDGASLAYFMHCFSETEKLNFRGEEDDGTFFHFNCFNPEDGDDPTVGLENGELSIPGNLLRSQVFDPVVHEAVSLIEDQVSRTDAQIDAIVLVGGFSACQYLFRRVQAQFPHTVVVRPTDADTATCRGAAEYGLSRRELVTRIVAPRAYLMQVKLPAEPDDYVHRPHFITLNNAGVPVCENRLRYLVAKGAILVKGQLVRHTFCKFSQSVHDRTFVAHLYTSESSAIFRYTDEGDVVELCKWTVDLGSLPTFQQQATLAHGQGFYTEFELGLELDSAEVRGVLLYNGQEWGRVTFDFLR